MTDNKNDLTVPVSKDDHIQGNINAPIVLVEYGDFECVHCGRAYLIIKKIQKHLGKNLAFVYRSFPLTEIHPHAEHAAEAAEIADAANKFWEYHDVLFKHQDALNDSSLSSYAYDLGIDSDDFLHGLEGEEYKDKVQQVFMAGVESGVNGTPTFFVNGSRYDGDWEYEPFMEYLSSLS